MWGTASPNILRLCCQRHAVSFQAGLPLPAQVHLPRLGEFLLDEGLDCLAQVLRGIPCCPWLATIRVCLQAKKVAKVGVSLRHLKGENRCCTLVKKAVSPLVAVVVPGTSIKLRTCITHALFVSSLEISSWPPPEKGCWVRWPFEADPAGQLRKSEHGLGSEVWLFGLSAECLPDIPRRQSGRRSE